MAKSYDELLLTGYGIVRMGNTWKGSRVLFTDN
jgi:hypothetical protein